MKKRHPQKLDRRGFLKSGGKVLPAIAVLGLALTMPLTARADCDNGCEASCSDKCSAQCATSCEYDCRGACEKDCTTSCSDGCKSTCLDTCKGSLTGS